MLPWKMGIRAKMQIAVAISLVLLAIVIFAFVRKIISDSYAHLERDDVRLSFERIANITRQNRDLLYEREFDWASWDDAYQFVQDGNENFKKTNLGSAELASNKIDLMLFIRANGQIVSASTASRRSGPGSPFAQQIHKELGLDSVSQIRKLAKAHTLTILHRNRPLNIAIRPITKTNGIGNDVGWLVWGQYVMPEDFARMAGTLEMSVHDFPYAAAVKDSDFKNAHTEIGTEELYRTAYISDSEISVFNIIRDFHEQPIWVERISLPRTLHAQGIATYETLLRWLVCGSIVFCTFLFLMIDFVFLRRVRDLSQVLKISDDPRLVKLSGKDELSELADTFRATLETLQTQRAALSRSNENLEEIILERTRDLTRATEEAERANAAKSEFLSHMSHELRTPLNSVIGFAQLLLMKASDPKTTDYAEAILKGGKHLLDLVNEILDLARIESGKLTVTVEPVQISNVLGQAISLVQPAAQARGVEIELASGPDFATTVQADHQRSLQILLNVLSNAIKYNRPHGKITIRGFEYSDITYRIEIEDQGYGVRDEDVERLFAPFERLGNELTEGTGLGLALSRNLANLMGGNLFLLKSCSEGSTFAIDFCCKAIESDSQAA